jgi:hypothetical protein
MNLNKIFIGSSTEALKLAEAVGEMIDNHEGTKAVLWSTLFPAGMILLEQIERLPNEIAGAVLLATPDVKCSRKRKRWFDFKRFSAPIANIVFEYGYLSARLGRKRVFILQFDEVDLASDLQGVTVIKDKRHHYEKGADAALLEPTRRKLSKWLDDLPRLTSGLPSISQVHGYSGTWTVYNQFTRWRGHDMQEGEQVYFNGKTFLVFQSDGTRGTGFQIGKLHVSIGQYSCTREVVNEVLTAEIIDDGTVRLRLRLRSRIVPGSEQGAEGANPQFREDLENVQYTMVLKPEGDEVATLRGPQEFEREADEKYQLAKEKFVHFGLFEPPGLET